MPELAWWTQTARVSSSINANISLMGKSVGSAYSLSVALSIYGLNLANWQYKFGRVRAVLMLYLLRSAPSAPWMSRPLWTYGPVLRFCIWFASINHKCNFRISNQHYICMLLTSMIIVSEQENVWRCGSCGGWWAGCGDKKKMDHTWWTLPPLNQIPTQWP